MRIMFRKRITRYSALILSEDTEVIETKKDLADEAAKTYESVAIDEAHFPSEDLGTW